eukprot:8439013-Alexandrium_andersonii.AAC.1
MCIRDSTPPRPEGWRRSAGSRQDQPVHCLGHQWVACASVHGPALEETGGRWEDRLAAQQSSC